LIQADDVLGFGFDSAGILEVFRAAVSTIAFIILNLTCAILLNHDKPDITGRWKYFTRIQRMHSL